MKSTTSVATTIEDVETHDDPNYRPTLDTISAASSLATELDIGALPSYIGQWAPRDRSPVPFKNAKPGSLAPPKTRRKIRMLQRGLNIPEGQCAVTREHTPKSSFEYAHVIPRSIALTEACGFSFPLTAPLTGGKLRFVASRGHLAWTLRLSIFILTQTYFLVCFIVLPVQRDPVSLINNLQCAWMSTSLLTTVSGAVPL